MTGCGLIIFIRNPELGKVKTRLAKEVGDEMALSIYISLLDHTRKESLKVKASRYLFYHNQVESKDAWSSEYFEKKVQTEGDLGLKMKRSFEDVLSYNEKAVIIGSDCPQISADIIEKAFLSLDHNDVVIGPSLDGGYYLLGLKAVCDPLFTNISWSTNRVFQETKERLEKLQLKSTLLPTLSDVDYKSDWDQFGWDL